MSVLGWMENTSGDEMPPQWMWPFGKEIDAWFADVDADRENRMNKQQPASQDESVG